MEGYVYQRIKVSEVVREFPFSGRYKTSGQTLVKSMTARGMLMPVVAVKKSEGYVIISGEARFLAALQLGWEEIPANLISPDLEDKDFFLISILFNWNQKMTELDGAFAIGRALQLKMSHEIILDEILPALGLSPEKRWIDEAREIMALDPMILEKVAENKLPYRGIRTLGHFTISDQRYFAEELAEKLSLTSNQLLKVSEWLFDLMKRSGKDLKSLLSQPVFEPVFKTVFEKPHKDLRQVTEHFFETLRHLRFPRQAATETQFKEAAAPLGSACQVKNGFWLEAPHQFEEAGILIHARLKDAKALELLLQSLGKNQKLVNSLFDIML